MPTLAELLAKSTKRKVQAYKKAEAIVQAAAQACRLENGESRRSHAACSLSR